FRYEHRQPCFATFRAGLDCVVDNADRSKEQRKRQVDWLIQFGGGVDDMALAATRIEPSGSIDRFLKVAGFINEIGDGFLMSKFFDWREVFDPTGPVINFVGQSSFVTCWPVRA